MVGSVRHSLADPAGHYMTNSKTADWSHVKLGFPEKELALFLPPYASEAVLCVQSPLNTAQTQADFSCTDLPHCPFAVLLAQ